MSEAAKGAPAGSGAEYRFRAGDAFSYVDSYRRHIVLAPSLIQNEIKRVEEQIWQQKSPPSKLFAELRAVEHALNFVMKKEEPGWVELGTAGRAMDESKAVTDLKEQLHQAEQRNGLLEANLKQSRSREQELQAENAARANEIERLRIRIQTNESTVTFLSGALGVVVVILILVLLFG